MNRAGELYACLYAKEFPAQAVLRLRPELRDRPVVVIEGEAPLERFCSFNSKARYLGIARGMTRVELDTFSSLIVPPRSRTEEASTHAILLECARTFSPRVEDRSENFAFLCVIDIAGTEKLLGPPEVLARELLHRVQPLVCARRLRSVKVSTLPYLTRAVYRRALPSLHPAMKVQLSLRCRSTFWTCPVNTQKHSLYGVFAHSGLWLLFQKMN